MTRYVGTIFGVYALFMLCLVGLYMWPAIHVLRALRAVLLAFNQ